LLTVEGLAQHLPLPSNGAPSLIDRIVAFGRIQTDDMAGLRERACRIGGRLEYEASVGKAVVRVLVPSA